VKLAPGAPDVNPRDDLAHLGEVVSEPVLLDVYFVYTVVKPPPGAQCSIGSP
jgi:hypothetical protein